MKWITRVFVLLGAVFLSTQLLRPDRPNRPPDPKRQLVAPPAVQSILDRSCKDCHSNQTQWPWYSHVSPISWWLVDHVKEGRSEFSVSDFGTYPPQRAAHKMEEVCEEVKKGNMPLPEYLWLHPSAKLSAADKETLCTWATTEQGRILSAEGAGS
jgi:hypothetical protein